MRYRFIVTTLATAIGLSACSGLMVRQQDIDAWVGMPVEALDTHSFFLTVPMVRTKTESGIEIRNYANGQNFASCSGFAVGSYVNASAFSNCASGRVACNNIFYIKDGKVIEYVPTGHCYTDKTVQPQERYKQLKAFGPN